MNDELIHYGTPHVGSIPHSGRYEYGSGEKYKDGSYLGKMDFLARMEALKAEGMSDAEIAKAMNIDSINEFRKKRSIARAEEYAARKRHAERLKEHGYGPTEIGRKMGIPESTVRSLLKASEETRKDKISNTADIIEEKLKRGEIIDVGLGTELSLNVTQTTLNTALKTLEDKGYVLDKIEIKQPMDPTKNTTIKYIAPAGTTKKDVWDNRGEIKTITDVTSDDKGLTFTQVQTPTSIDVSRVTALYRNEGGIEKDGLIGIRPGVADLSMGNSSYAQVRIGVSVDGEQKYYIKGMAIYDDNVPAGKDIIIYSNKNTLFSNKAERIEGALKETKDDPDNPFGATIYATGQTYYTDKKGNFVKKGDSYILDKDGKMDGERYSLSPINKLKSEGEWDTSSKSLSAQFLSKQSLNLIQNQLDVTYKSKLDDFNEIMSLENPVVKSKLLNDFAEGCDKDAKSLKAAALPRQNTRVLIPVPELKDTEIYAPGYKNGEKVCLVRFPHGGTFEIPTLVVNNKQADAKNALGNALDAVGINKKVADRLSGADFDGDFVLVIPTNDKVKISTRSPLKALKDFDTCEAYPGYPGMKVMSSSQTGKQMGIISNLITDMTLQNPTEDEIARAVKHSMVIIDAEKHKLNWKQSEKDNCIDALKEKYQKNPEKTKGYGGASSLISRAKSTVRMPEQQLVDKNGKRTYTADPETGEKLWGPTGNTFMKRQADGTYKKELRMVEYAQMDIVKDARKLSNGTPQEEAYANYANKMKALANKSRKESLAIPTPSRNAEAAKKYAKEVDSLNSQLNIASKNKPLERQALLRSSVRISALQDTHPEYLEKSKKDKYKKEKAKILTESRAEVGAKKRNIKISDREWEAIQANAISGTKLRKILDNSDMDIVRKLATPRNTPSVTSTKQSRIKALSKSGFTISEISEIVGVSPSTVSKYIK